MASIVMGATINLPVLKRSSKKFTGMNNVIGKSHYSIRSMRIERPLEELYSVRVEKNVSAERLESLGVSKWSMWRTGKCKLAWDWQVDQLVYVEEGEVRVVPQGSKNYMQFVAGDLVRYPKWFEADLWFNAPYRERYCFRAYGDD